MCVCVCVCNFIWCLQNTKRRSIGATVVPPSHYVAVDKPNNVVYLAIRCGGGGVCERGSPFECCVFAELALPWVGLQGHNVV